MVSGTNDPAVFGIVVVLGSGLVGNHRKSTHELLELTNKIIVRNRIQFFVELNSNPNPIWFRFTVTSRENSKKFKYDRFR